MARRLFIADVSGGRVRVRSRFGWMDGVTVALGSRGMMVDAARQCEKYNDIGQCVYANGQQ